MKKKLFKIVLHLRLFINKGLAMLWDPFLKIPLFSLCAILLSSCDNSTPSRTKTHTHKDYVFPEYEYEEFQLLCNDQTCPQNIGLLIIKFLQYSAEEKKSVIVTRSCTAFVVESNLIDTNAHCLPSEYQGAVNKNGDFGRFYYLDNNGVHSSRPIKVNKILYSSLVGNSHVKKKLVKDYARLQLSESLSIQPNTYRSTPLYPNDLYYSYAIKYSGQNYSYFLYKISECQIPIKKVKSIPTHYKLTDDGYVDPNSFLYLTIEKCQPNIEPGNSGAPLISATNNQVAGIISAIQLDENGNHISNSSSYLAYFLQKQCLPTQDNKNCAQTSSWLLKAD